ncbi:hypothetical protein CB0940_12225 [Cercospora beticola]|uniref:RING-type domain-containing protein n=1 Tax=Cercospora beticola TaxID=122368 RepID=A0A2G5GKS3_CERBT|nr:hypothetical protein CB0940_12225 [Cercospora beticola]PIA80868.1 hypothetical protein CB0940_12225 [Cercospora beticola]WPB08526.1 hypothetical protein RHO25_013192 [Cercospora beticola]
MTPAATNVNYRNDFPGMNPRRVYIDLTGDEPVECDPFDLDHRSKNHNQRCDSLDHPSSSATTEPTNDSEHHTHYTNDWGICAICQELLANSGTCTTDGITLTTFRTKCKHAFHTQCFTQHIVETDVRVTAATVGHSSILTNRRHVVVVRCPLCREIEVEFLRSEVGRQIWDAVAKAMEDEVTDLFEPETERTTGT